MSEEGLGEWEEIFPGNKKAGGHVRWGEQHTQRWMYGGIRELGPTLQMHRKDGAEKVSWDQMVVTLYDPSKKSAFGSQAVGCWRRVEDWERLGHFKDKTSWEAEWHAHGLQQEEQQEGADHLTPGSDLVLVHAQLLKVLLHLYNVYLFFLKAIFHEKKKSSQNPEYWD